MMKASLFLILSSALVVSSDKFLTRIAFVDFDGLAALKIIKDDDFSSNNLLDIICPQIVKGVLVLKEWVQNQ